MNTIASLRLNTRLLNVSYCPNNSNEELSEPPSDPFIDDVFYHFNFKQSIKPSIFGTLVLIGGGSVVVALIVTSCLHPIPGINSVEVYTFLTCGVLVAISGGSLLIWDRLKAQQNKQEHISSMIAQLQRWSPLQLINEEGVAAEEDYETPDPQNCNLKWNKKFIENLTAVRDSNAAFNLSRYYRDSGGQVEVVFLKDLESQKIYIHVFTSKIPQGENATTEAKQFLSQKTDYRTENSDDDENAT